MIVPAFPWITGVRDYVRTGFSDAFGSPFSYGFGADTWATPNNFHQHTALGTGDAP